jgi:hypothetical protein
MKKLEVSYVGGLLHDALTARVKNTHRSFNWLVLNTLGEWRVYRNTEEPILDNSVNDGIRVSAQAEHAIIRTTNTPHSKIALVFNLADYRPSRLGTMKVKDGHINTVHGGGTVFAFIEDYIDQTYQWYIDNDIERPSNDLTHAYDISLGGSIEPEKPLEEAPSVVDDSPEEAVDDPFTPLYDRTASNRVSTWTAALHREIPVEIPEEKPKKPLFAHDVIKKAIKEDPAKFDYIAESKIINFLSQSIDDTSNVDLEVRYIATLIRRYDRSYNILYRDDAGEWNLRDKEQL